MNSINRRPPIAGRPSSITSVCSEIGRGHPSYLDSTLTELARLSPESAASRHTLSEFCTGTPGIAWGLAASAYRLGALGGVATWLYNQVRSPDARPSGLHLSLLGSDLRQQFKGYQGLCVVDHPLLAHILAPLCRVAYVHGEIAAPGLCAVPSVWRAFVPLERTRQKLIAVGSEPSALSVTGLMIEPALVAAAEPALRARLARIESDLPLTVGFFLSGAQPRPHLRRILAALASLARDGNRAVLFSGSGLVRAAQVQLALRRRGIPDESAQVIWTRDRQTETVRTAELFSSLDLMVAAAHERTNWACGLGLPMFALLPHIGPFARENCEFASTQGVCLPIASTTEAATLGATLAALRQNGRLAAMARAGWGRHPLTGAVIAARELLSTAAAAAHLPQNHPEDRSPMER